MLGASLHPAAFALALAVHIATALVGFGGVAMTGIYGSWGRRITSPEDLADVRRYFSRRDWASRSLVAVAPTGAVVLWLDQGFGAVGHPWAVAAIGCWAAVFALAVRVIWPAERHARALFDAVGRAEAERVGQAEQAVQPVPPDPGERDRLGRRLVWATGTCDVIFAVALILMIFQPGG
jgi:hypothetical protein